MDKQRANIALCLSQILNFKSKKDLEISYYLRKKEAVYEYSNQVFRP